MVLIKGPNTNKPVAVAQLLSLLNISNINIQKAGIEQTKPRIGERTKMVKIKSKEIFSLKLYFIKYLMITNGIKRKNKHMKRTNIV
jgi:hypothetical protein